MLIAQATELPAVQKIHYSVNENEEDFSEYAINARVARC